MQQKWILDILFAGSLILAQPVAEDSRAALNRGVEAFKGARYAEAVSAFDKAVTLDPGNVTPRLYLATALMTQWIPGANTPENEAFAARAESEFRHVLDLDPREKSAIASLASLAFNKGKSIQVSSSNPMRGRHFEEAEIWYRKLLEIDSSDKTALYSLGVVQWERFYPELMAARSKLGMRPEDPGPLKDLNTRADLRARFGRIVEDGIAYLNRALAVDPQFDDAMAYLNLLYRERADYAESNADYKRDVDTADELVAKALAARKLRAESGNYAVPLPPPPPPGPIPDRIRVSGSAQANKLIQHPIAIYPALAKQARVQGTVRLSVIIGKDGRTSNIQLVSGHPLLVPSAVDAVKQYVYETTLLNGQPVEVITQVEVNFTLTPN